MAFDWQDYLVVAQSLMITDALPQEARLRSAISRAYYAAFHVALSYYENKNIPIDATRGKHESVIVLLKRGNPEQSKLGIMLDALRSNRNRADYNPTILGNMTKLAQASLKSAQDIIAGIAQLK